MSEIYDAAYAPNLDTVVARGGIALTCYITGSFAVPVTWPATLHAKGLGAIANYEEGATEIANSSTRAQGQAIGRKAAAGMLRLSWPQGLDLYFSVDTSVPTSRFPAMIEVFRGIGDAIAGRWIVKVYGEGALIDALVAAGVAARGDWLSASSSFPGFNPASVNVAMVQRVGTDVPGTDKDDITHLGDIRAWWPNGATPLGAGTQLTTEDPAMAGYSDWDNASKVAFFDDLKRWLLDPSKTGTDGSPTIQDYLMAIPVTTLQKAADGSWAQRTTNWGTIINGTDSKQVALLDAIDSVKAALPPAVDSAALSAGIVAAITPHLTVSVDPAAVAADIDAAIAKHFPITATTTITGPAA